MSIFRLQSVARLFCAANICPSWTRVLRRVRVTCAIKAVSIKSIAFAAIFIWYVFALAPTAAAASYTDNMTDVISDGITQYWGAEAYTLRGGVADNSVLTFSSFAEKALRAYVDYRVQAAESVTIYTYNPIGTFAVQGDSGVYLGISNGTAYIQGQYLRQAMLHPGTGIVYTDIGGPGSLYCHDPLANIFRFKSVSFLPEDLMGYGVDVKYSADGQSFSRAEMSHAGFDWLPELLCYERYTAVVPTWAKYIRVEFNDVTEIEGQGRRDPIASRYTMLASVTVTGENLIMGETEEKVVEALETEYYIWSGTVRAETSSQTRSTAPKSQGGESSEKTAPLYKFEGTITASTKSQKERVSKSSVSSKSEPSSSQSSSQPPSKPPANETAVYEVNRGESSGNTDAAVKAYIVAVSGALTLSALFRRR